MMPPAGESSATSPWRDRRGLWGLAPLVLLVVGLLPFLPWYSNFDVDSMTWAEQVRAVARTGSIGFDNGPSPVTNTETATLWFVAAHGKLWGIYPAPLSYLLAPAMVLGGFRGVIRALWLSELCAALLVYATVWRLTRRTAVAVGAAWALVTGTSWLFWATTVTPFVPGSALLMAAVYARLRCEERSGPADPLAPSLGYAGLTGLFASLAVGSHVVAVGAWACVGASLVVTPRWRDRLLRPLVFAAASAPSLGLMSWVNHLRFGAWSPLSYGPCNAQNCAGAAGQTAEEYARLLKVGALFALTTLGLAWVARRSRASLLVLVALAVAVAAIAEPHDGLSLRPMVRALFGYLVDLGTVPVDRLTRAADGVGNSNGGWNIRSLLECSPVLAAAAVAWPRRSDSPARRAGLVGASGVCLGLLVMVALRANERTSAVWGHPFLNIRYLVLMAPSAMALAAVAAARLPWRAWHALAWVAAGVAGAAWMGSWGPWLDPTRRMLTHVFPVAVAASLLALLGPEQRDGAATTRPWRWRPRPALAAWLTVIALAYGTSVTLGIDRRAVAVVRGENDAYSHELERVPERRFMLLGGYAMDHALALHDRREIRIINVGLDGRGHSRSGEHVRRWMAEGGTAYLLQDRPNGPWHPRWAGLRFEPVAGTTRLFRVVRGP